MNVLLLLQLRNREFVVRMLRCICGISMIFVLLEHFPSTLMGQVSKITNVQDLPSSDKVVVFSTDKIANTLVSGFAVRGTWFTSLGNFRIDQDYKATSIISTNAATRDDQMLLMEHSSFVHDSSIALVSRGLLFVTQDSRDIGLSSLQRYAAMSGFRWNPDTDIDMTFLGGLEHNKQLGIEALGYVGIAEATLSPMKWEDFTLSARSLYDIRLLDSRRTNTDFSSQFSLLSLGDTSKSSLQLNGYFRRLGRDFYTFVNAEQFREVEQRLEDRYGVYGQIYTPLQKSLFVSLDYSAEQGTINRRYAGRVPGVLQTYVNRGLKELQIQLTASLLYQTSIGQYKAGMHYFSRTERNAIQGVFDINPADESTLRAQEQQRDNSAQRVRIFADARIAVTPSDSLYGQGAYSLLRYDTPSVQNYDDRDELQALTELHYAKKMSKSLTVHLTARVQLLHLVFIKQQRSSLNNWNRIFTLSPSVSIRTKKLVSHPHFEVLANYTVYDYEQTVGETRSFSFRQLSIRDSIQWYVNDNYHIEVRLYGRHFERGRLFWNDFAETPISSNDEYFIKVLGFRKKLHNWSIGIGGRYYALIQKSLILTPNIGISGDAVQRFYGPEIQCDYRLDGGSSVVLNGWYERQTVNGITVRYVPNLFLHTHIFL